jgi:hypothetical protein
MAVLRRSDAGGGYAVLGGIRLADGSLGDVRAEVGKFLSLPDGLVFGGYGDSNAHADHVQVILHV